MLVKNIILLSLIVIYSSFSVVICQTSNLKFEHLTVEDGLSSNQTQSILQSRQGFIWIATQDGLNKYDGYKITVFRHDPADSNSLGSNDITHIYEDPYSYLWVSTMEGGLNRFDAVTEKFTRFMNDPDDSTSISSNTMEQTVGYRYETGYILWVGTANGLDKFHPQTEEFTHYPVEGKRYPYSYIESLAVDSAGMVWIGTTRDGLYKFDPYNEKYTHYPPDQDNYNDPCVISLMCDKSGMLWIGAGGVGGLTKFDPQTDTFTPFRHDQKNPQSLSNNWIHWIIEDHQGQIWAGSPLGGLNMLDRKTEQFVRFRHNPGDPNSIGDNTVTTLYEDRSTVLWIGTWKGVSKMDPGKSRFFDIKQIPGDSNSLDDNYIFSLSTSADNNVLWVGTKMGGLNRIDLASGSIAHYRYDPDDSNSIPSDQVSAVYEDRSGILWTGTYGGGIARFDADSRNFIRNKYNPDKLYDIILAFSEDTRGRIWLATRLAGLARFDRSSNTIISYHDKKVVTNVMVDKSGVLWYGGFDGLEKFNYETGEYKNWRNDPQDTASISNNAINIIHEGHLNGNKVIWVGTKDGLNGFDPMNEKFYSYDASDGLASAVINGILEDEQGNLWLSTNNGLSRFNPQTKSVKNYDVYDGLLSNQFCPAACIKGKDDALYFGGTNGLNYFYPDQIRENSHKPKIVITEFNIFNQPVRVNQNNRIENGNAVLNKHISFTRQITISYRKNIFSFEFAALDYRSPKKNKYAYIMEGVDPDWVYTDASRRFATYTNLDPGEYIFRVKGSNNDGLWNEEGTSIKIIITPPWWRTNLAYAFYLLFIIGIIATTWKFQVRRIHLRNTLKMKEFEAGKLQEVDSLKSRFFANISHEFRTPLTLILGPVKQMLDGKFAGSVKEQYGTIIRNGERLLQLINQILDLSKLESGEIKVKVSETDIVKFIKGLVLSFSPLAETKKVTLKFSSPENYMIGYVDRDKMEKIITNLISNAFKFTPEGGIVEVAVTNEPTPNPSREGNLINPLLGGDKGVGKDMANHIKISISNTGPGIPSDQLDKIFDRFYQVDDNYKKDGEGSGIGLALTKELVEVCRGEISVNSVPGESTTFTVELPIVKESFEDDEVITPLNPPLARGDTWGVTEEKESVRAKHSDQKFGIEQELEENASPQQSSAKSAPLLLIIEDNPEVTSYISSFMANDYRILKAENGREGLKKTLDKYPDLIISDVMMPEMDGFEFCKKIKTDERISHIPVILLTAKADLDSKIEGLEFGCDDYVTKPFEARELQIRTRNLIEQRKKLREKFSAVVDLNPADIAASSMDEQLLQRLLAVFEEHMEDPEFSIEQLAREIGMSRIHLNRKIQAITNLTTSDFIRTLRLQRAAKLLKNASGTVAEIAYKVGFNNLSYFSRTFRKHFGKLPSDFSKE